MYDLFFIVQGMYGKFAIIFPLSVPYRMSRAERKEPSVCRNGRTVAGPAGKRGRDPVSGRIEAVPPADGRAFSPGLRENVRFLTDCYKNSAFEHETDEKVSIDSAVGGDGRLRTACTV